MLARRERVGRVAVMMTAAALPIAAVRLSNGRLPGAAALSEHHRAYLPMVDLRTYCEDRQPIMEPTEVPIPTPVLNPPPPESAGEWTQFTTADEVQAVAVNPGDGSLWAATAGGLVHWDRASGDYDKYTTLDGLPSNAVSSVAVAADGTVWAASLGNGIGVRRPGGEWETHRADDSQWLLDDIVWDIAVGDDETVWIGTESGVSVYRQDGNWHEILWDAGRAVRNHAVHDLALADDGSVWFASDGGAHVRRADGSWTSYTQADGLASSDVTAVAVDLQGNAWFGHRAKDYDWHTGQYRDGSLSRLASNGTWSTFNADDGPLFSAITSIVADQAGYVWFASDYSNEDLKGVTRVSPAGAWSHIVRGVDLPRGWITSMLAGQAGDIWFPSLGSGVGHRSPDGTWTVLRTGDPLISNTVWDVELDPAGNLWIGTSRGISMRRADGAWFSFVWPDLGWHSEYDAYRRPSLAVDGVGRVWLGTGDGVRRWSEDEGWSEPDELPALGYSGVPDIAVDGEGNVWFAGGGHRAIRLAPSGEATYYDEDDSPLPVEVSKIAFDPAGNVWFGCLGVRVLAPDGTWTVYDERNSPLDGHIVHAILFDRTGASWVGTTRGLHEPSPDGTWRTYLGADGLAGDWITSGAIDDLGNLWLSHGDGGVTLRSPDGAWSRLTAADGLPSNDVQDIEIAPDGAVWFGTIGGVARWRAAGP